MKYFERIRDPVHDLISFNSSIDDDQLIFELLGLPTLQRLRRIKQLGFSDFVYPGATHSRFSHVLGAMQMARRMLDVFQKNRVITGLSDIDRRATLAAALLHDVGHGPYSHVFEEIAEELGHTKSHEMYTLELIDSEEVKSVLEKFGVFEATRRFFSKEPGDHIANTIISSQLDCDRIDFLCRDRYHCGVRSAQIDLAWLFDSLSIQSVLVDDRSDASQYAFVFEGKGLTVAEQFVIAYMEMYKNVYFHKTTRGVQHLVKEIIRISYRDYRDHPSIKENRLLSYLDGNKDLEFYKRLDDGTVLSLIHACSDSSVGRARDFSNRFLNRHLLKMFGTSKYGSRSG